jgi:hypothetical protein
MPTPYLSEIDTMHISSFLFIGARSLPSLKHLEIFCNVCEGHLISMNFLPRNWGDIVPTCKGWQGNYAYLHV